MASLSISEALRPGCATARGAGRPRSTAFSVRLACLRPRTLPSESHSRSLAHPQARRATAIVSPLCAAVSSAAAAGSAVGENPAHSDSDYIVLGLAQCFVKDEANKLQPVSVIEAIPAGAVECMDNGGVTSYTHATGTTLGVALKEDPSLLPAEFQGARFADEFQFRTLCAARTWKRQHAQENLLNLVPVGVVRSDFNFSTEDKRVLNMENEVTDDDNIKQDISIDVYGRSKEEEEASQQGDIEKLYNA